SWRVCWTGTCSSPDRMRAHGLSDDNPASRLSSAANEPGRAPEIGMSDDVTGPMDGDATPAEFHRRTGTARPQSPSHLAERALESDNLEMGLPLAGEGFLPSRYQTLLKQLGEWSPGGLAVLIYVDIRNLRDVNRMASPLEGDRLLRRVEQVLGEW